MKIGLVSPYDFSVSGGVNNHIAHLAGHFVKCGHQVKILAPCSALNDDNWPCDLIPVGRPIPLSAIGTVARVPVSPWLHLRVDGILQREKFDILHIHEPLIPMLPISVLLTSQCTNVGTFHACHDRPRYYAFAGPYLRKCVSKLRGKIAVSHAALEFVSRHIPADYHIIPNGIDTVRFSPHVARRPELSDGKLNILFVGRLERRKGLDHLLRAFVIIKKRLPKTRLVVVGSGTKLGNYYYRDMIADLGLEDVLLRGFVNDVDLPSYYNSADIFCSPATSGESFGIVLLEAMACGTTVVASDIPGYASVISHEKEGLLVKPKDEEALAQSIIYLLENNDLRKEMGLRGQSKALKYSWERISHDVMEYYCECLNNRSCGMV